MTQRTDAELELLTFRLADQEYALDIMTVREIRSMTKPTCMPHAPSYVRGVINLRGTVLPVIDLSARLGMDSIEQNDRNVIIVVRSVNQIAGLLVNAVSDIVSVRKDGLIAPPDMHSDNSSASIQCICIIDDRMVRVLDLQPVLSVAPLEAA